jgi:hypothetical protein
MVYIQFVLGNDFSDATNTGRLMKVSRPDDLDGLAAIDGTIIIPAEDTDISLELIGEFTRQLENHHHQKEDVELLRQVDGEDVLELNLEALEILCWEHKQYSAAQGFSVSQLDVLRAIQSYDEERVLTSEIKESPWVDPYKEQTIQKALATLIDRGLIKKEGKGVYRYTGPAETEHETNK